MFSANDAIAKLDAALAKTGQDVMIGRGDAEQGMRAFVRGFKADELVGLLQQGDREVVVSPSSFGTFGLPREQDKALVSGVLVTVMMVDPVEMAGTLVRANLVVRG